MNCSHIIIDRHVKITKKHLAGSSSSPPSISSDIKPHSAAMPGSCIDLSLFHCGNAQAAHSKYDCDFAVSTLLQFERGGPFAPPYSPDPAPTDYYYYFRS